jgi:hypothetical protein
MRSVLLLAVAACGRVDFEARSVPYDAAPDAAPVCPSGTTELTAGSAVCIEIAQRSDTWTTAKATCAAAGRRLCADAEWALACDNAIGLDSMIGPDWEWVAEESGGVAQKRGFAACSDTSSHEIFVDPYEFRCCVNQ